MRHKIKEKGKIKGRIRLTTYKAENWFGNLLIWLGLKDRKVLRQWPWKSNLVVLNPNSGLNLFIKHILGDTTYPLEINQGKIGTGDTTPADANTDLETTFLDGIDVAVRTEDDDDEITISFFISDSELTEQEYKEFGVFCGSRLFARSLISPVFDKSVGEDVRIDWNLTLTNT
jgi:hypothetical protein